MVIVEKWHRISGNVLCSIQQSFKRKSLFKIMASPVLLCTRPITTENVNYTNHNKDKNLMKSLERIAVKKSYRNLVQTDQKYLVMYRSLYAQFKELPLWLQYVNPWRLSQSRILLHRCILHSLPHMSVDHGDTNRLSGGRFGPILRHWRHFLLGYFPHISRSVYRIPRFPLYPFRFSWEWLPTYHANTCTSDLYDESNNAI